MKFLWGGKWTCTPCKLYSLFSLSSVCFETQCLHHDTPMSGWVTSVTVALLTAPRCRLLLCHVLVSGARLASVRQTPPVVSFHKAQIKSSLRLADNVARCPAGAHENPCSSVDQNRATEAL